MPTISKQKKEKIQEQIIHYLFTISPDSAFTSKIAEEIARDEEFTKSLLIDLKNNQIVSEIKKNPEGTPYQRRQRWILTQKAYSAYKTHQ